ALTASPAQACSQAISSALLVTLAERYSAAGGPFRAGGGALLGIPSASKRGLEPRGVSFKLLKLFFTGHSLSRVDPTNAAIVSICAGAVSLPDSVTASG